MDFPSVNVPLVNQLYKTQVLSHSWSLIYFSHPPPTPPPPHPPTSPPGFILSTLTHLILALC